MDIISVKSSVLGWLNKYKYACVVLLIGIFLMLLPEKPKEETVVQAQTQQQPNLTVEGKLEDILKHVEGAGEVEVMLSIAKGEQIIYQTDTAYSNNENSSDTRTETILTTDCNRNETGLIHQKNPPVYLGAVILAQGAENPVVKLAIVEAVSNITGLGADKISVIKMQ